MRCVGCAVESSVELLVDSQPSVAPQEFLDISGIETSLADDGGSPLSDRPHEAAYPRPDAPVLSESAYVLASDEGNAEDPAKPSSSSRFPAIKSASKHSSASFSKLFEDIVGVPVDGPLADQDSIWALAPGARGRLARQALQQKKELEAEKARQAKAAAQNRLKMNKTVGPLKSKKADSQPAMNATLKPSKPPPLSNCLFACD